MTSPRRGRRLRPGRRPPGDAGSATWCCRRPRRRRRRRRRRCRHPGRPSTTSSSWPPRTRSSPGEPKTKSQSSPPYSSSYAIGVPGDATGTPASPSSPGRIVSQRVAAAACRRPRRCRRRPSAEPGPAVTAAGDQASGAPRHRASLTAATIERRDGEAVLGDQHVLRRGRRAARPDRRSAPPVVAAADEVVGAVVAAQPVVAVAADQVSRRRCHRRARRVRAAEQHVGARRRPAAGRCRRRRRPGRCRRRRRGSPTPVPPRELVVAVAGQHAVAVGVGWRSSIIDGSVDGPGVVGVADDLPSRSRSTGRRSRPPSRRAAAGRRAEPGARIAPSTTSRPASRPVSAAIAVSPPGPASRSPLRSTQAAHHPGDRVAREQPLRRPARPGAVARHGVATLAEHGVVARDAEQQVGAAAAGEHVVAVTAVEVVHARAGRRRSRGSRRGRACRCAPASRRRRTTTSSPGPPVDPVVAGAAAHDVDVVGRVVCRARPSRPPEIWSSPCPPADLVRIPRRRPVSSGPSPPMTTSSSGPPVTKSWSAGPRPRGSPTHRGRRAAASPGTFAVGVARRVPMPAGSGRGALDRAS